ncbi:MAG: hypothetical protein HC914_21145 [Chloroflexaceae bacterium]|nr:hypothetical protein [Chloroflexaceae bacterium]
MRKAISTARSRRKKTITRTIIFKLHKPGRRKTRALLWAQVQVTRMTVHILEALRETPGEVRYDKALAFVQEAYSRKAQGEKSDRTIILATILEFCFNEKRTSDIGETTPEQTQQQKEIKKWTPPSVPTYSCCRLSRHCPSAHGGVSRGCAHIADVV